MHDKQLSEPFLAKMTSGENGRHCDIFPHGSIHTIRQDKDGNRYIDGKYDKKIPDSFLMSPIKSGTISTKKCPECENTFEITWPFLSGSCIRCFERLNIINRDAYRDAIRQEILNELKNQY